MCIRDSREGEKGRPERKGAGPGSLAAPADRLLQRWRSGVRTLFSAMLPPPASPLDEVQAGLVQAVLGGSAEAVDRWFRGEHPQVYLSLIHISEPTRLLS